MANILLINPPAWDFKAYDHWLKPLGLLQLGGILKNKGHRVRLFDFLDRFHPSLKRAGMSAQKPYGDGKYPVLEIPKPEIFQGIKRKFKHYGIPFEVFERELRGSEAPDLVLVTSLFTYWHLGGVEVIRRVREIYPGAKIVLGGIYPALCYEHARNHSGADLVIGRERPEKIIAEIESLLPELGLSEISKPSPEKIPLPDFSFYPELSYACLLLSLGCPFRCPYCASSVLQPVLKFADPESSIEQISRLYRDKAVSNWVFYDDALLYQAELHLLPFLEKLMSLKLPLALHTPNALHAAYLTREVADRLYASGFKTIRLGFEIADPVLQKVLGGKVDSVELETAVLNLQRAGFSGKEIGVYVLTGYPGSSFAQVKDSLEFIHRLGAKSFLSQFSPIPGTPAGDSLLKDFSGGKELDPHYTNNTYWWYKSPEFSVEELEKLRMISQDFNRDF